MVFIIVFLYVLVGFIEGINLSRKKQTKMLIVYLFMMTGALLISVLLILGVKIPSPAKGIRSVVLFFQDQIGGILQ
ncbi:MAG: hypothetical protein KAX49_05045 [Halanaerobiales bacterium]|nr:hypothetical protein [Halanaerobiales bacterium]